LPPRVESLSARKHRAIIEAATTAFLSQGYLGTTMDEVAAMAGVSKRTVYQHFVEKESLFTEIVLAATDEVDEVVRLVADGLHGNRAVKPNLTELARRLLAALMQPRLLRLRRLIIAHADLFPELGRAWYERGFERVLVTLATHFQRLTEQGQLDVDDPVLAAHHFVGLVLWIPMNQAMFTGVHELNTAADIARYADSAVSAFLSGYDAAPRQRSARMKAKGRPRQDNQKGLNRRSRSR
jgi:TetR/AcrR family transcriptional repressor of mexJK operon